MRHVAVTFLLLAAAIGSQACLKTQTTHVLYLSPSGAVTWSVRETDVHSDDPDQAKAAHEESEFLRAIEQQRHPSFLALEALGGRDAVTALTRGERPWEALTSARFDRAETLAAAILDELQIAGHSTQMASHDRVTLTVEWISDAGTAEETPVLALVEHLEAYRIVLTEGRFIAAEGFRISPDGRAAVPVEQQGDSAATGRVSLTWTVPALVR